MDRLLSIVGASANARRWPFLVAWLVAALGAGCGSDTTAPDHGDAADGAAILGDAAGEVAPDEDGAAATDASADQPTAPGDAMVTDLSETDTAPGDGAAADDRPVAIDSTAPDTAVDAAIATSVDAASDDTAAPTGRTPAAQFHGTVRADSFASSATSWSRALATTSGLIVTANPDSDSISVLSGSPPTLEREIPVGRDPRTVALTSDGRYAVTVNRGDATVSVVDLTAGRELYYLATGPLPYGVVIAGGRLYVTEWATGQLAAFDPVGARLVSRASVGAFPAGIAHCGPPSCALSGGRGLLVTHFYSGQLSRVDPDTLAVVQTIDTGAESNLAQHVAISPDGKQAFLPQTRSFTSNLDRAFNSTVFPIVDVVDLATFTVLTDARLALEAVDRSVAMPFAVDFLAGGTRLAVANAASDDISVIDLASRTKVAHLEVGANPQAVAVSGDGTSLYVNECLDGKLGIIPAGTLDAHNTVGVTTPTLPADVLEGKKLFWTSNRLDVAKDKWISCAACHFDGLHDARTWQSFPDGVRNTPAIFDLEQTAPYHWSGDLDEIQDVEATIRNIQAGTGLTSLASIDTLGPPLAGLSPELDALAAFLRTLHAPPSPYLDDKAAVGRGQAVFTKLGCATCHAGPLGTDGQNHDVGTGDPATERNSHGKGVTFNTPALRLLWMTAPFLHDGSAATLNDVFDHGPNHTLAGQATDAERADLVTYLRAL